MVGTTPQWNHVPLTGIVFPFASATLGGLTSAHPCQTLPPHRPASVGSERAGDLPSGAHGCGSCPSPLSNNCRSAAVSMGSKRVPPPTARGWPLWPDLSRGTDLLRPTRQGTKHWLWPNDGTPLQRRITNLDTGSSTPLTRTQPVRQGLLVAFLYSCQPNGEAPESTST